MRRQKEGGPPRHVNARDTGWPRERLDHQLREGLQTLAIHRNRQPGGSSKTFTCLWPRCGRASQRSRAGAAAPAILASGGLEKAFGMERRASEPIVLLDYVVRYLS